jgi:type IV pilus assembly protein PilW
MKRFCGRFGLGRRNGRDRRGFTLLELLVGAAVSSIVLVAICAVFISVNQAFVSQGQITTTVGDARTATSFLERILRLAGYGIDPRFAFDFSDAEESKDNVLVEDVVPAAYTDDLVFRYRDPMYLRRGQLDASGNLKLEGSTFGIALRAGQPVIVACVGAQTFFVTKTSASASATDNQVALVSYATGAGSFPPVSFSPLPSCMKQQKDTAPYVMLMYDLRIRVVPLGLPARPFLVAFHDLASADPTENANFDPIAADVDSFQVAYFMNRPPPGVCTGTPVDGSNGNWILGDNTSDATKLPDDAVSAPLYTTDYTDCLRFNNHPGNIRFVRITMSLRSPQRAAGERDDFKLETLENNVIDDPKADGFYRTVISTTVRVPNMAARSFFLPPLSNGTSDDLNASGG